MDQKETLKILLNTNHSTIKKLVEDISEEESMVTGKDNLNHIRWQLGHLVLSDMLIIRAYGEKYDLPEVDWVPLFGRGSKLSTKSEDYPALAQIKERLYDIYENQIKALNEIDITDLDKEIEFFPGFTSQALKGALFFCQHEFYHAGQIAQLRRILGCSALFG